MTQPPVPSFDHIFIVIMENHGYDEIIGNAEAPYINQLAARCGVAANYASVAHPSLPNYLALTGGDTFGVTTDCTDCFQQAPNLAVDRISPSGRTWRAYMESMPSPGYLGDAYPYMQKHDPFVYYDDLRTDPAQLAKVVPLDQLATDLATAQATPAFGWITPSMLHDMHDGTIAQGDTWLSSQIPALLSSPAWTQQRSLLVITWDEDDNAPGNQVATLVIADGVPAGFRSAVAYNHYSLLRTIELAWGLAPLTANDAGATVMSDFFPGGLQPQHSATTCNPQLCGRNQAAAPGRSSSKAQARNPNPPACCLARCHEARIESNCAPWVAFAGGARAQRRFRAVGRCSRNPSLSAHIS